MSNNSKLHLIVDNGEQSRTAMSLLEEAGLQFECHNVTGCRGDFTPPRLLSPEGDFYTVDAIRRYLSTKYVDAYRESAIG